LVKLATLDLVTLDATVRADVGCHTALSIFFRLQVTDFDRLLGFFSLCHFIFPSYLFWVVCRSCCVSDTEQQLMPALNVLCWNQVVEANQFISCALAPFIS
jgi:hypothetical protein